MAKAPQNLPARTTENKLAVIDNIAKLAQVIPNAPVVAMPDLLADKGIVFDLPKDSGWEEAPDPFCPMVDFSEDSGLQPPMFFRGKFDTLRVLEMSGRPNNQQNIYEFLVYDAGDGEEKRVGIWGSGVLNSRMAALNPDKGQDLVIIFTGFGPAKSGQNAPKLFRVFKLNTGSERDTQTITKSDVGKLKL